MIIKLKFQHLFFYYLNLKKKPIHIELKILHYIYFNLSHYKINFHS